MVFVSSCQIGLAVVILVLHFMTCTEGDDSVCLQGWFGSACSKLCHCPTETECSPVNGFCSSGRCHPQWFGTGCQTRLPQLSAGPDVESLSEQTICIGWKLWNRSLDLGDVNVTSYKVQVRLNGSLSESVVDWKDVSLDVVVNKSSGRCYGCLEHIDLNTEYEFRIIPIWLDYGKPQQGLPSNASSSIIPSTVLSAPEGPVINLTLELASTDQSLILVSWKPPVRNSPFLSGYSISYSIVGVGDCSNETHDADSERNISSSVKSYTIQDTLPWRRYRVRISALYSNRSYPNLEEIISRETDPVGVAWNLSKTALSSRSLSIAWNDVRCSQRGGRLVYYDARIQELNSSFADESKFLTFRPAIDVSHLLPFTRYSVRVRYVNAVGQGPFCDDYIVQTESDAPPRPEDVGIRNVTDEAMLVIWSSPKPSYGLLLEYRVIYWPTSTGGVNQDNDVINVNTVNSYQWITGLKPFTYYYVQVQARNLVSNGDGWGSRSLTIGQVTKDGRPTTPVELKNTSRSDTCVTVEWQPPATANGVITSYKVSYSLFSIPVNIKEENLQSNVLLYLACHLTPGARYQFRVAAATRNYLGDAESLDVSTEPGVPPVPVSPSVKAVTEFTVTMLLQPVTSTFGPITSYFVVVYDLAETSGTRRKRSAMQDPAETIPLPGYTAARIAVSQVTYEFTVGDGQVYGGYLNKPVRPDSLYTIYYVVASTFDGVTRMSFTQTVYPVRTLSSKKPSSSTTKNLITSNTTLMRDADMTLSSIQRTTFAGIIAESKTTLIVIVVVVLLVVIVASLVVSVSVWCYCHRRNHHDNLELSFDRTKQSWVKYYHNNFSREADKTENNKSYKLCTNSEAASPASADHDCCLDDVPIAEIEVYRKKNLEAEFRSLPSGNDLSTVAGSRAENKNLSRNGILPFDHSRVAVQAGGAVSDYYNASYVPNYKGSRRAYIAAESPFNGTTLRRFWNMIYQENVRHIVYMEGSHDHSPKYWPNENGATLTYGSVVVSFVSARKFASFIVRTFLVALSGEKRPRHVRQYHFTEWTDDEISSCPPIALLDFRSKLRSSQTDLKQPVLVHCRTGVEKSCVFIAVDSLLTQAKAENCVNVYEVCAALRRHRSMSIATEKHYTFVCDVIVEALCTNYTVITNGELRMTYRLMTEQNTKSHKSCLTKQFELISDSCATVSRRSPVVHVRGLSVAQLDSYQSKNGFLLVEQPPPSRESEFWRLVHEKAARCVVTLSSDARSDDAQYGEQSRPIGPFELQVTEEERSHRATVVRTVRLRRIQAKQHQPPDLVFKQFGFYEWDDDDIPMSKHGFIRLLKLVHDWRVEASASEAPVVVQCKDGSSKSGLFCACYVLCQRMAADNQVDIFHAIKTMKLKAPDIINSQEQYKFCFKVLWDYIRLSRPSVESLGLESNSSDTIGKRLRLAAKLSTKQSTQDRIEDTEANYKETNIMNDKSNMEPENKTNVRTIVSVPKDDSEENLNIFPTTADDDLSNVQIGSTTSSPNEDRKVNVQTILSTPLGDVSNA